jgi:hypothetical protein
VTAGSSRSTLPGSERVDDRRRQRLDVDLEAFREREGGRDAVPIGSCIRSTSVHSCSSPNVS